MLVRVCETIEWWIKLCSMPTVKESRSWRPQAMTALADNVAYPSIYPTVISVGATGFFDRRASYSNYGEGLDILAREETLLVRPEEAEYHFRFQRQIMHTHSYLLSFKHTADYNGDGFADGVLQETVQGGGLSYSFFQGTSMVRLFIVSCTAIKATLSDSDLTLSHSFCLFHRRLHM